MALGINSIDKEHQTIIHIINHLLSQINSNNVYDFKRDILGLLEYSEKHFRHEEKLFEEFNYPQKEEHKEQHEIFIKKIHEFKSLFDNRGGELVLESTPLDEQLTELAFAEAEEENEKLVIASNMTRYLFNWLINHILVEDKKYAALFKKNGAL